MFRHPKYYKELRKLRNKSDQAISYGTASTDDAGVRPGPGLKLQAREDSTANSTRGQVAEPQASSSKLRYTPTGILLGVDLGDKPQEPANDKQQASSFRTNLVK